MSVKKYHDVIHYKNVFRNSHETQDHIRTKIKQLYLICLALYIFSYNILLLFGIDSMTFDLTNIFPLAPFFLVLFPASFVGCILNVYGLIKSYKIYDHRKIENGLNNLLIGVINLVLGIFGLGILYIMTS